MAAALRRWRACHSGRLVPYTLRFWAKLQSRYHKPSDKYLFRTFVIQSFFKSETGSFGYEQQIITEHRRIACHARAHLLCRYAVAMPSSLEKAGAASTVLRLPESGTGRFLPHAHSGRGVAEFGGRSRVPRCLVALGCRSYRSYERASLAWLGLLADKKP